VAGAQNLGSTGIRSRDFFPKQDVQTEFQQEFEVVEQVPDQSYASFLNSKRWREIRELVLRRCHRICEACGPREAVIAHHTTYAFC
jgi:hypothetical protein